MAMSKKHFIALADSLKEAEEDIQAAIADRPQEVRDWAKWQSTIIRNRLADYCASQNYRFMRGRWLAYIDGECGPNGGKVKHES